MIILFACGFELNKLFDDRNFVVVGGVRSGRFVLSAIPLLFKNRNDFYLKKNWYNVPPLRKVTGVASKGHGHSAHGAYRDIFYMQADGPGPVPRLEPWGPALSC